MRNSLLLIANVLQLLGAQVSVTISNLSDEFCSVASDIRGIDPTDSQASHMFVGDTNILYDVCPRPRFSSQCFLDASFLFVLKIP
jgi:hypothetical protein